MPAERQAAKRYAQPFSRTDRLEMTIMRTIKTLFITVLLLMTTLACGQVEGSVDTNVFVAVLKPGLDNVKATINDQTKFIATKGQLVLYWNYSHNAFIADGRFGYIPPESLVKVNRPYFKFNFSKRKFVYDKEFELNKTAQTTGADLNSLIARIQRKDSSALHQYFKLHEVVDGASAEEFTEIFWALINFWNDSELTSFILSLNSFDKKTFCELLIESSYCDPYRYYKLYYPRTLQQITSTK